MIFVFFGLTLFFLRFEFWSLFGPPPPENGPSSVGLLPSGGGLEADLSGTFSRLPLPSELTYHSPLLLEALIASVPEMRQRILFVLDRDPRLMAETDENFSTFPVGFNRWTSLLPALLRATERAM